MKFKSLFIIILLILFFTSCSSKKFDYKKHHLEQHKKHIELIIRMNESIDELFNTTLKYLKDGSQKFKDKSLKNKINSSSISILSKWKISLEFYKELHDKTQVYYDDCIQNKLTSTSISNMNRSTRVYSLILASRTDIEMAISDGNYDLAIKKISVLHDKVNRSGKELLKAAKEYQKQIEKFDF